MSPLPLTIDQVRRLAIAKQKLSGPLPQPDKRAILEIIRSLGCLQIDPIRAVERTQYLVLWSRLDAYDPALLDELVFQDRLLFEYWAHAASIVLTENYPLHAYQMRHFAHGTGAWAARVRDWMDANQAFQSYILRELKTRGPLYTNEFVDQTEVPWQSGGWSDRQNVRMMLSLLWEQGQIAVAGRSSQQKQWVLMQEWLPASTAHAHLDSWQMTWQAAQIALRALGAGTKAHIHNHFLRGYYVDLESVLAALIRDGHILPVQIEDWSDTWYVHADDLGLLDDLVDARWQPRTTLLSPFDNLICDRQRTEQLWDFYFRIEIYVPAAKRQYGYYVLPILYGDRLIGRLDPKMDRQTQTLYLHAVYAEPSAPAAAGPAIAAQIAALASWLGAQEIVLPKDLPRIWQPALRPLT